MATLDELHELEPNGLLYNVSLLIYSVYINQTTQDPEIREYPVLQVRGVA